MNSFLDYLSNEMEAIRAKGLYKHERIIDSPQKPLITLADGRQVLNFCANNYLGLADHPDIIAAAEEGLRKFGNGMASVRFICGTHSIHKELEAKLSEFYHTEDTILYSSCFDANGGLFETLLSAEDAVISDALNHASIIDGIRLCKAKKYRYANNDMHDLENKLQEAKNCRFKIIATDGVFSMDGIIADLKKISELAKKYHALVMVDDCHAAGFLGKNGKGAAEYCNVLGEIDIITGTFGKALGGSTGGYTTGRKEIISWLRQRSRPYLFSNSIAPSIANASLKAIEIVQNNPEIRLRLREHTSYFRERLTKLGFTLISGTHPIIPIMLGDAKLAQNFAEEMLKQKIYVIGFSYPVVPENQARIRVQISSAHSKADLEVCLSVFENVGKKLGVIQ